MKYLALFVVVRRLFAAGLLVAAGYHVVAILNGSGSAPRHAVFVLVNLLFAAGFWRPFRGFVALLALLVLQQLVSHGRTLWRVLETEQRVDWPSVIVLIGMPLALVLVALEARLRQSEPKPDTPEPPAAPPRRTPVASPRPEAGEHHTRKMPR